MSSSSHLPRSKSVTLASLLALLMPGAGFAYLGQLTFGGIVLAATLILAYIISWALDNFKIGATAIGGFTSSWLWLLLAGFWAWNVFVTYRRARYHKGLGASGLLFPALVVYIIAWQVTDVRFDRLIDRFDDAKKVLSAIVHPDLFMRDSVAQSGRTTFWAPCTNPPQPFPALSGAPVLRASKSCGTVGDSITLSGEGFLPETVGSVYWNDLVMEVQVQAFDAGNPVQIVTGADGKFEKTIKVSSFVGRQGIDPNAPSQFAIDARFVQEVGPPRPSENFGDIVGKLAPRPAPDLLVSLGLVEKGTAIPTPIPGKIAETIALGLMATLFSVIVAIPLSFFGAHNIMSRLPGGTAIYYFSRAFFNIMRSIDTLIWGLIVIVWVGLGPFAGMLALAIHSVAALAKLYSEEIEHIDAGPVEAVTATGANLLQVIRFAVIPQIIPPFLAYTLLRWDINMRSATVVGFVAGGGIGFFVVETIRKGGYEQYAAALWVVAIVIIIVDYLSARWREAILVGETKVATVAEPARPFYKTLKGLFYGILLLAVFAYSWQLTQIDLGKLLDPGKTFGKLVSDFINIDLSPSVVDAVIKQLLITTFQALLATTLGGVIAIPFSFLAARNLTGRSRLSVWLYYLARAVLNVLRSIEALLYVAIFVFWVGIGAFAGMLALAVTTFALIGKLFSEAIENIDPGPLEAVTATGANRLQTIVYAILPQIVPPFVSYSIYQWDINIRIATIIGFAGGGGIGLLFSNYSGQLQYHKAGTVILAIVIIVTLMDFASAKIREKLV